MPSKGDSRFWGMEGNLKRVREKPSMRAQSAIQKSLCRAVKAAQTNEKTPKRNEAAVMNGFSGNTASINAPATNAALTTANGLRSNQSIFASPNCQECLLCEEGLNAPPLVHQLENSLGERLQQFGFAAVALGAEGAFVAEGTVICGSLLILLTVPFRCVVFSLMRTRRCALVTFAAITSLVAATANLRAT